ncbi:uncharacterized protein K452DRAFT_353527 [Aplosporella prunicola CBS 121167]|uniref:Oxo-4-hydroxy-4-carboxy-5-ureidoimidazoline decarboxylase domain-containing protein n=1 Tax=Aplosporella prunicola CBS 121167 TaxID=1176127 RepID=A0A6A6B1T8_9PEZI|nr:uncharacterized protein K452DRAFT_353527 [Aplosporella prunicola CBS 121167]KAF2137548.1 hypothetical protein K452DRAFT_353527 [Aplosporella prunicola CBS 121167]
MDIQNIQTGSLRNAASPAPPLNLPSPSTLTTAPTGDRIYVLDVLFEPSQPLHNLALPLLSSTTFTTYADLVDAVHAALTQLAASPSPSDTQWLERILAAHPRLGEKKVESAQSAAEQAALRNGSGHAAETEAKELAQLNTDYEARFPGLRYVVFVNGRGRPEIFADMRRRIERADIAAERVEAIQAMCDIANDRARKLQ